MRLARVDDLALAVRPDQELRDPLQRALGRREPDPLRLGAALSADQVVEALEGQGEVGAALGLGDGVDLVDDHRLDAGQDLARREVMIRYSDSGVVIRMSGGLR